MKPTDDVAPVRASDVAPVKPTFTSSFSSEGERENGEGEREKAPRVMKFTTGRFLQKAVPKCKAQYLHNSTHNGAFFKIPVRRS